MPGVHPDRAAHDRAAHERVALRALQALVPGGLRPGNIGSVCGPVGAGKTQLLVWIAIERLLAGERVMHVASRESVAQVRDAYDSTLAGLLSGRSPLERAESALQIERRRLIHATAGGTLDVARLTLLLEHAAAWMDFRPTTLVVDGVTLSGEAERQLRELARSSKLALWTAYDRGDAAARGDVALELFVDAHELALRGLLGVEHAPVRLGSESFAQPREETDEQVRPSDPRKVTLFSGGAAGAEAAFGEAAERHGVNEVNFTFAGHAQARSRGAHPLTARELAEGDVSLNYVSKRLRRSYSESAIIRRVLQSLWHQVKSAQVVFVIGTIQEDGTVTGGTGWSVELARMWNKRLWVFDQEKDGWYRWTGDEWFEGVPLIEVAAVCGTGTKALNDRGRAAIQELFARSFA